MSAKKTATKASSKSKKPAAKSAKPVAPRGTSKEEAEARTKQRQEEVRAGMEQDLRQIEMPEATRQAIVEHAMPGLRIPSGEEVRQQIRNELVCVWFRSDEIKAARGALERENREREKLGKEPRGYLELHATDAPGQVLTTTWAWHTRQFIPENQAPAIAERAQQLLDVGPLAILDATAELLEHVAPEDLETNTLSALGNLVSKALRRRVLLRELEAHRWNLAQVSTALRLGYGSAPTLRAIKDMGLSEEYEKARASGLIKRGGGSRVSEDTKK